MPSLWAAGQPLLCCLEKSLPIIFFSGLGEKVLFFTFFLTPHCLLCILLLSTFSWRSPWCPSWIWAQGSPDLPSQRLPLSPPASTWAPAPHPSSQNTDGFTPPLHTSQNCNQHSSMPSNVDNLQRNAGQLHLTKHPSDCWVKALSWPRGVNLQFEGKEWIESGTAPCFSCSADQLSH